VNQSSAKNPPAELEAEEKRVGEESIRWILLGVQKVGWERRQAAERPICP
jgi:hypothetical protein